MKTWWVREVGGVGLALACLLAGCSYPLREIPRGTVRGKVTYKGQPLPAGFLVFYNASIPVEFGVIKPDGSGTYEASVTPGLVQVTVRWESSLGGNLPPERSSRIPANRPRPSPSIPGADLTAKQANLLDEVQQKYGSLRTAKPLTFDVAAGEQTWNINLD